MSQNIKHTAGPWRIRDDEVFHNDLVKPNGRLLATFYPGLLPNGLTDPESQIEAEANARLASASPDLVYALRVLVGDVERSPRPYSRAEKLRIARDALALAGVAA